MGDYKDGTMNPILDVTFVRLEGGGAYENVAVSNTPETFAQVAGWMGMDKDILFCPGCTR